ncbi:MAG: hypothetical protein LBQ55_01225, partial [Treponema sp.]|nr:hypothetical protein [Treponema sp.]
MSKTIARSAPRLFVVLGLVVLACGNPIMEDILEPLYDEEESGEAPAVPPPASPAPEPAGPVYTVTFSVGEGGGTAPAPRTAAAGKDGSAANPVPLALALDLQGMPGGAWQELLQKIANKGKYVALDLSACALSGGFFDPGISNTGEPLITALTLPEAAADTKSGSRNNPS